MFHSFRKCQIQINGNGILAEDAQLSEGVDLTPVYLSEQRHSNYYAPNFVAGSLKLNYYLTGPDALKNYFNVEQVSITGNFRGLAFQSGYLKSYSVNCNPNSAAVVDAEIVFFDALKGVFEPQQYDPSEYATPLMFSDATINNLDFVEIGNIKNVSFNYQAEITPVWTIDPPVDNNAMYDGLVAYWKLDEATSATRYDSIGINHLLDNNGVTQVVGTLNNAAEFAVASSQFLSKNPPTTALDFVQGESFSVSAWVYVNSVPLNTDTTVINKGGDTAALDYEWQIVFRNIAGDYFVSFFINNGGTGYGVTKNYGATPPTGEWIHLVAIWNADSKRSRLYVNGILEGDGNFVANEYDPNVNGKAINIGGVTNGGNGHSNYFNGKIDEVAVWNRAIDVTEAVFLLERNDGQGLTNIRPHRIAFGPKEITAGITFDSVSGELPIYGQNAGVQMQFRLPNTLVQETFTCSGKLVQRNLGVKAGGLLEQQVQIRQNYIPTASAVTSFYPAGGGTSTLVRIQGTNMADVIGVKMGDRIIRTFYAASSNELVLQVPEEAVSGAFTLISPNGSTISTDTFNRIYTPISVETFAPTIGKSGDTVLISGNNFYDVSSVTFGSGVANFTTVSPQVISATVPADVQYGSILVGSNLRGTTGTSFTPFVTYPQITGVSVLSGIRGDSVVLSGRNLGTVTGVYFGGTLGGYTVNSNLKVTATVPSGITSGQIRVVGAGGASAATNDPFLPQIHITGMSIASGKAMSTIRVSGKYFDPQLMTNTGTSQYKVYFGNTQGSLSFVNENLMTGYVPSGRVDGAFRIAGPDGVPTYAGPSFSGIYEPMVSGVTPLTLYSGKPVHVAVDGSDLYRINTIRFTGNATGNQNVNVSIGTNYLKGDLFGVRANITGYPLTGVLTGYYNVYAVNSAGTGILQSGVKIIPRRNVAMFGRSYQSSTQGLFSGWFGNDGQRGGSSGSGNIILTQSQVSGWWEVDLKANYGIDEIRLYNTSDINLISGLTGLRIQLLNSSSGVVWSGSIGATFPNLVNVYAVTPTTTGRYINLQFTGLNSRRLSFAELEAY